MKGKKSKFEEKVNAAMAKAKEAAKQEDKEIKQKINLMRGEANCTNIPQDLPPLNLNGSTSGTYGHNYYGNVEATQYGWKCPECKIVHNPDVEACYCCVNEGTITTTPHTMPIIYTNTIKDEIDAIVNLDV